MLIFLLSTLTVFLASIFVSQMKTKKEMTPGGLTYEYSPWYAGVGTLLAWISGLILLGFLLQDEVRPYLGWTFLGSAIAAFSCHEKDDKSKSKIRSFIFGFSVLIAVLSAGLLALSLLAKSSSNSNCHTEWDGRGNPTYCE